MYAYKTDKHVFIFLFAHFKQSKALIRPIYRKKTNKNNFFPNNSIADILVFLINYDFNSIFSTLIFFHNSHYQLSLKKHAI